jgi:hypothetical protein
VGAHEQVPERGLFTGATGTAAVGVALVVVGIVLSFGGALMPDPPRACSRVDLYHFSSDRRSLGPFSEHELSHAAG